MRIALIAMSGVRAFNPELTRLGMTLPGLMERGRVIGSLPSLSLLTLAALTPDHHELSYHEVADLRELAQLPECDLAAITSFTAQVKDGYALADRYRSQGTAVVMGGLHVSALPEEALAHCDAVVVGEGELSWPALLRDFEAARAQRVYHPGGREYDLGQAPIPRFDLLQPEAYNRITVQTQRGCPWRCEFCASSILLTERYKMKPPDRVAAEIRAVKAIWPRPFIEFADDNTFVNPRNSRELMAAVGEEGVRWFTETDVSVAEDAELLTLMADAGCAEVLIGFESPSIAGLEGLELRRNWKRRQISRYEEAVARIQSHGIAVNACFILGLEGDGPEIFEAVGAFVERAMPFDVQITVLTPLPGTPLYARLLREGRLLEEGAWEKCTLFDVNFQPQRMSSDELERGLIDLGRTLYCDSAKRRRSSAFKQQRRTGRAGPSRAAASGAAK